MIKNQNNEQNRVFPIIMSKPMAKRLKEMALSQERSASDIVRSLLSDFLISEAKNVENSSLSH